ncbi:rhodanese-like domain-containing protein [Candidatus Poribacteria bacterium]|nr:rhodanese-like domain-containing protein [Candidatus Poribacteria bacterium]
MFSYPKQTERDISNVSERKTLQQIIKEMLIVSIWIAFGALTLWGADGFGLFSSNFQTRSDSTLQVDFPLVYQIWQQKGAVFVDARSAASFRRGHIPDAVNVPINRAKQNLSILPTDKKMLLITYCGSVECPNAYQLMNILLAHGYQNVKFFSRGLRGWQALGYPLALPVKPPAFR